LRLNRTFKVPARTTDAGNSAMQQPDSTALKMKPLVRVQNLIHSYPSKKALKGISFGIDRGSFHALLGPNGAGKSTLFSLISRLFKIQSGEIEVNGHSLRKAPAKLLADIGMVFQQSTLDMDLSVVQNLDYHASLHGMSQARRKQRIEEELVRIDMEAHSDTKVRALNGGHRRRVEIARALLHKPSLLLLDEATVGLDPKTRSSLNQHVRMLCSEQNVTVLWATHLIEEIQMSDPVTLLHQGAILGDTTAELLCRQAGTQTLVDAFNKLTNTPHERRSES
jgi:ABC-2 type transport system ATP-binding protein